MPNALKLAIAAVAAAAALSRQTPEMVWDSNGPHGLPIHRRGKFKPNARKSKRSK